MIKLTDIPKSEKSFCIIMLPDAQNYVNPTYNAGCCWEAQLSWIFKNREKYNIKFVTQVGDMVSDPNEENQFKQAFSHIGRLNGVVPFGVCAGNHDVNAEGKSPFWARYFPEELCKLHSYWVSSYDENKNNAQKISVNGQDYLFIHLEFLPSDGAIAWAKEILAQNPDSYAVISTHSFLIDDPLTNERGIARRASRVSFTDYRINRAGINAGEDIYKKLVEPYGQVKMVLCGHYVGRYYMEFKIGNRIVHTVLADLEHERPLGGNGFMRILQFDCEKGVIRNYTYSPLLDAYKMGEYDMFEIKLN